METATKNLENDHDSILKLIDVMEIMTGSTDFEIDDLEEVVDIIKNFADGMHHAKEETLLFPLMAERGFSMQQGPIAVMLSDHTQGRDYVRKITESIQFLKEGDLSSLNLIYKNMLGYGELLRNHIQKENNVLFRMADNAFSQNDQEALLIKFKNIENHGLINHNDFVERIKKLVQAYNLS